MGKARVLLGIEKSYRRCFERQLIGLCSILQELITTSITRKAALTSLQPTLLAEAAQCAGGCYYVSGHLPLYGLCGKL